MSLLRSTMFPIAIAAAVVSTAAYATDIRPFDRAAFETAQQQNRPVIVFVHAPWCPVCRSQIKTMDKVTEDPAYRDLIVFRIDYDSQRPLWQSFGVTKQSTLIGYRGSRETGRIAYESDEAKVRQVLAQTLR
ncbi:thioredoxin family protein [Hansschlegelia sp. KR7-227]|uniref:thioredoxin family protein n=1 Tax=Hansschlegelia sp. KR7-227 TaxID=3400914 RepID=UPI003C0EA328